MVNSYYNKKYKRIGYVFRDRYKSQGIYTEKQIHNCIRYIYDNPVKAGICEHAKDYKYSNYQEVPKHEEENDIFIDIETATATCEQLTIEYLKTEKISIDELKKDKNKINDIVNILHNEKNISLRNIAKTLKIPRENLRRVYKK